METRKNQFGSEITLKKTSNDISRTLSLHGIEFDIEVSNGSPELKSVVALMCGNFMSEPSSSGEERQSIIIKTIEDKTTDLDNSRAVWIFPAVCQTDTFCHILHSLLITTSVLEDYSFISKGAKVFLFERAALIKNGEEKPCLLWFLE